MGHGHDRVLRARDPAVLDALSPTADEVFDPEGFLHQRGTVYVLGTSSGASATAGLVGAFVEDITEAARRLAARSPAARLDPPLTLVLDEAANYPLPSLPSLMSDGGGSGICTVALLQSLAQARTVWGEHAAAAISPSRRGPPDRMPPSSPPTEPPSRRPCTVLPCSHPSEARSGTTRTRTPTQARRG